MITIGISEHSSPITCEAILFDLDGVLVDSGACVERTLREWAARHGLDPERVIEVAHGRRVRETVPIVAPTLVVADEVAALEEIESRTTDGVFQVPRARELLESLPSGAWAIVTSGSRAVATLRIRHTNLLMPRVFICGDEVVRGKPDPEGYLEAASQLGIAPSRCVVIEDAPAGLEAARAAGMRSIGVAGTYRPSALSIADLVVGRLSDVSVLAADSQG